MLWTVQRALLVVGLGPENAVVGKCKYMSTERVCPEELLPFKSLSLIPNIFSVTVYDFQMLYD